MLGLLSSSNKIYLLNCTEAASLGPKPRIGILNFMSEIKFDFRGPGRMTTLQH